MVRVKKLMAGTPGIRFLALATLRRFGQRDVTIRHALTRDPLVVHAFMHRGYWFHRKSREWTQTQIVSGLLADCNGSVVDVGAHIGYMSVLYRALAPSCDVIAIEPSALNRMYLQRNVKSLDVKVLPYAVGSHSGSAILYEDDLTGQNSSLVEGFEVLEANRRSARVKSGVREVQVVVRTLDDLLQGFSPVGFIKIDVEGFELAALEGAFKTLTDDGPVLQVELQKDVKSTLAFLERVGYAVFVERHTEDHPPEGSPSVIFAVPRSANRQSHVGEIVARHGYRELRRLG